MALHYTTDYCNTLVFLSYKLGITTNGINIKIHMHTHYVWQ